jgi:flagellar export protein FliJ
MHKPRFTAVLALYETQEEEARRRVGQLERERVDLMEKHNTLGASRLAGASGTTLQQHEQLSRFWGHITEEMRRLSVSITRTETAIKDARIVLMQAHQRVATFGKLRERDDKQHQQLQEKRFTRELDEFAAGAHGQELA